MLAPQPLSEGLRRRALATRDAHSLYRRFGFKELARPEGWMEKVDTRVYKRKKKA